MSTDDYTGVESPRMIFQSKTVAVPATIRVAEATLDRSEVEQAVREYTRRKYGLGFHVEVKIHVNVREVLIEDENEIVADIRVEDYRQGPEVLDGR